jgi:hypothetical protein
VVNLEKEMAAIVANFEKKIRDTHEENTVLFKAKDKEINDFKTNQELNNAFIKEKDGLKLSIKQLNEDVAEQKK